MMNGIKKLIKNKIMITVQPHLEIMSREIQVLSEKKDEDLLRRMEVLEENIRNNNNLLKLFQEKITGTSNLYEMIDYGNFENHFRGSREVIKTRQKEYLPFFKDKKRVLDLGCGRGEFLELMGENHIAAKGVDLYQPFVEECKEMGFCVEVGDAIDFLRASTGVNGIFAGQLVEHLPIAQVLELCRLAYEKLLPGGCIVLETPNPMSLAIYTHAFYIDPSHNKPVHPFTLQYFLQISGFSETQILFTESSRIPVEIPELTLDGYNNQDKFNQGMQEVVEQLFGSQDYAIIAMKGEES